MVFNFIDDNINDAFKVSNDPALVGWNPSIEPQEIFKQITEMYGHSSPAALLQYNTLFWSVYSPQDAPKVLFCQIKGCQEVQILRDDLNMAQQLLNNAGSTPMTWKIGIAK